MTRARGAGALLAAAAGILWFGPIVQAQEPSTRLLAGTGGVSLVVARPTRVVAQPSREMRVPGGRFQPLSSATKLALLAQAGYPAPATTNPSFTLTMQAPWADGKGFLHLSNAGAVHTGPPFASAAFGPNGSVDFRSLQLSTKLFMIHYQVQASTGTTTKYKVYIWFDGTTIEAPAKPVDTVQDILVLVSVPPGATWDPNTRAMTTLGADGYWVLRGVEVTPM